MPIFTTTISNQNTAGSSGVYFYPQIAQLRQYGIFGDTFNRGILTPTNSYNLYSTAADGTGSVSIVNLSQLRLLTDNVSTDKAQARTTGFGIGRIGDYYDNRTVVTIDIIFALTSTTLQQGFIGFLQSDSNLTALPTTALHMGLFWDTTGTGKFILSSSNGTTQVTNTTNASIDTSYHRLNITWNGNDSATISLYGNSGSSLTSTQIGTTQTVTSLANGSYGPTISGELYFFVNTQTVANREIDIYEWIVQAT